MTAITLVIWNEIFPPPLVVRSVPSFMPLLVAQFEAPIVVDSIPTLWVLFFFSNPKPGSFVRRTTGKNSP